VLRNGVIFDLARLSWLVDDPAVLTPPQFAARAGFLTKEVDHSRVVVKMSFL